MQKWHVEWKPHYTKAVSDSFMQFEQVEFVH